MSGTGGRRSPPAASEPRHTARQLALQMLYQWEVGRLPLPQVLQTFWEHQDDDAPPVDPEAQALAAQLAAGVEANLSAIDAMIAGAAEHWRLERMNVLDRLVLRLATYELLHRPEAPARVVINEALELGRAFCGEESVPFINGVVDAIRRTLQRE